MTSENVHDDIQSRHDQSQPIIPNLDLLYPAPTRHARPDRASLLLQRLGRVGTHEAEGLKGDGGEGHQQDEGQCGKVDDRGVPDTDRICLEPSADIGI